MPDISKTKSTQRIIVGLVILDSQTIIVILEYNIRNIFLQKSCGKWGRETSSRPRFIVFFVWNKTKWLTPWFQYVLVNRRIRHIIKANCMKLDIVDPEVGSILIFFFFKWFWNYFFHHILSITSQDNYFSCCIILIDQISLSECLYLLRYLEMCVLWLFLSNFWRLNFLEFKCWNLA